MVDLGQVVERVRTGAQGRPRVLVGIDGPGGSGKSTLAGELAAALGGAYVVPVDAFSLPSNRRHERRGKVGAWFDLPRLAREVIVPGAAGQAVRYRRYDWTQDALAEWVEVPAAAPMVVEGVFCLAADMRQAYTFRIWCKADRELRLRRGLARDGEGARSLWVKTWMPAEDAYVASEAPERKVDLVVESA